MSLKVILDVLVLVLVGGSGFLMITNRHTWGIYCLVGSTLLWLVIGGIK